MDNQIFNVNGKGDEMLLDTLRLVFKQDGGNTTCKAWAFTPEHGLVLFWHNPESFKSTVNALPAPMTPEQCLPFISAWLAGEDAAKVKCEGQDADYDHDGSNSKGWRVYVEDWGHVADCFYAICGIRPVYLWYGK